MATFDSTRNRAGRRGVTTRRAKTAMVAGTAAAAMTLGMTGAPSAAALDLTVNWDPTYTAGTLAGILNAVGNANPGLSLGGLYNSGPPQQVNAILSNVYPPLIDKVYLNLFLKYLKRSSTPDLYNTIANIPAPGGCTLSATSCRYALMLATSGATYNLVDAYRAQIQSVTTGNTPAGLIPFTAAPGSTPARPTQTDEALVLVQNPVRPNGGLLSRFPEIATLFGLDPNMPAAGKNTSVDGTVALVTSTVDVTWAYDPIADFPVVFNPFSIANSLAAALPLNLAGGLADPGVVLADSAGNPVTTTDVGLNLAVLLQMGGSLSGLLGTPAGKAFYATLVPNQLPLLTPLRLPGLGANAVLSALNSPYLLGNPVADALEPASKILVNIGYPDVVTPTDGGTYNRTFLTGGTPTKFGSVSPLTPEEKKAVPGDVWNAFVGGVQDQLAKPFWGVIVPNPKSSQPSSTSASAAKPAAAAAAPAAQPGVSSASASNSAEASPVSATGASDPSTAQAPVVDAGPSSASAAGPASARGATVAGKRRGGPAASARAGIKPVAGGRHRVAG